jgi:alpha-beta hydrolase superfamily lysophospholipase
MASAHVETFTAGDGYVCHFRRYEPAGEPSGTVVGLHGIQSHGGWYEYSSTKLSEAGFRVLFPDRRGSGLNKTARGDAPSFWRLLDDLAEFLRSPAVRRPVFLAAVSWGGKLAVALQRSHPGLVDGLALLCPGFFPQVGLPPLRRLGILLKRLRRPTQLVPIPLNDPELFTVSPDWRLFLYRDALALRYATTRFLVESVRLDRYLRCCPKFVTVPTLLLLAGRDRIIRNDRTHRFFHRFATDDKNVITYPEAHHTLEFEPQPDRYLAELIRWLDRHSSHVPPGVTA